MSVQAGRIDDAVRHGPVLMESKRPRPPEGLAGGFCDIRRHSHPDRVVLAQINKTEIRDRFNLCVAPRIDLLLIDREIAHEAIAPITQDRFREADLECVAQRDNTKPPCRVTLAGITEPARRLSIS